MVLNHTHSYIKWRERRGWYKCADVGCSSIVPAENIKDKEILCSHCNQNTVILNPYQRKLARPRCVDCANTKEAKDKRRTKELVENVLQGVFNINE